ncbi:prepilin-type N-terminal cleavage/methylation domain-containing protein [Natranaerovirga pectinivora]|uniref:Prepilin-type N-terminal cleavage/methylation domain-containing protein n=1 Tax=Natranaerovirga pectinivora TaxID=682400 RepID=A0A4R3MNV3_9FIRM|nr:prepilin-type N-terminal cleavage/methylation domain-containing protein [Natranaerovirga pectinivora]TCT16901.1 prepilin-type N-terminal cleavage/methylation domain-containing protein [Natranaerovirga pectinivora]
MWNKKGFTLIEIIIGLAIIGIIAISIIASFSNMYVMTSATKNFTDEVFQSQQEIELQMQEVKNQVILGSTPAGQQSYIIFQGTPYQRSVKGYPREVYVGSSGMIYTIVADTRMPEFEVATISNVGIDLRSGSNIISHAYISTPSLNIRSSTPVITDPNNVNLMNLHKWYVSRAGFNIPMIENPEEPEIGVKYPRYPNDYIIIPNETLSNLNNIHSSYRGRHIIYTITPAAKSGKMGVTIPSNPVFISGLPITEGLVLHLDASYINKEDTNQVRTINSNEIYAKRWLDLSSSKRDAIQNQNVSQPQLVELEYSANQWGKSLRGYQGVTMSTGLFSPNNTTNLSVIVSAKIQENHSGSPHNLIINGGSGSWGFGWNDSGSLCYYLRNAINDHYYASQSKTPDHDWHVFTGIITQNNIIFRIDGNEVVVPRQLPVSSINIGPVRINWHSQLEIGEIIIYNRDISGQDLETVENYLYNKYSPTA